MLSKGGRCLSLLVEVAIQAVQQKRPLHTPMWQLHKGSVEWLSKLRTSADLVACAEFDVEDCFLNTTRQLVLPALDF